MAKKIEDDLLYQQLVAGDGKAGGGGGEATGPEEQRIFIDGQIKLTSTRHNDGQRPENRRARY